MEDRFKINKKKENMIYLLCFLFSGGINIAFFISLPSIIRESVEGDMPFIFLGGGAAVASFIGLLIHYIFFRGYR